MVRLASCIDYHAKTDPEIVALKVVRSRPAGHEIAKHGYPTGNYFCWTLTTRCSPHARRVTKVTFYIRGFSRFVTSTIARTAHVQVGSECNSVAADFFEAL
jgi:hypothetical protein